MATFHSRSALKDVLAQADSRAVVGEIAPEVLDSPLASGDSFPLRSILGVILEPSDPRIAQLLGHLTQIEDLTPRPQEVSPIVPPADYESAETARASASVLLPSGASANRMLEIAIAGPSHGNPFTDVELTARFSRAGQSVDVGGFYDGDGRYALRFLPAEAGTWEFVTKSNARSLDGLAGSVEVAPSDARGAVRADGFHFSFADGTPFTPIGTTAYAWTHQDDALQQETLDSLAKTSFSKLRMSLFPKHFLYNANEPDRFVFPRTHDGWDLERFDLAYFRTLEQRLEQLAALGIDADLILFHPYDRWGFSHLGKAADDRYVSYVVRRLSAFPNVWWSLANEYDLLLDKSPEDWDRIGRLVRTNDPYGHPISIHNWVEIWDYASEWATHCSIQCGEGLGGLVREWRRRFNKPVIIDECGYEGDLDQGWGFLTAEELVSRSWAVAMSGGYVTHGETYYSDDETVFWAKGGRLRGESPARLAFLGRIIEESPTGRIDPLPSDFDAQHAGARGEYQLIYFGAGQPSFRNVVIPQGMTAHVDVIDSWNMTVERLPGEHKGTVRFDLPGRPYCALRLVSVDR
ncbi:DUF5605 domain-containing protein [Microbacterium sp. SS28]|uniref:DUF5605 domain-containing protein n=1 Tax=Microbacterium sp. SS28 TaxID=2919948 RepID=UPI001FA9B482|nr:DUF5605 domain-containing protein [Microbacterium sp. SS28]